MLETRYFKQNHGIKNEPYRRSDTSFCFRGRLLTEEQDLLEPVKRLSTEIANNVDNVTNYNYK